MTSHSTADGPELDLPSPVATSKADLQSFARLLDRGLALLRAGDLQQARAALEGAVALFPDNLVARQLLALALLRSGHLERALVIHEALLHEQPASPPARVNVAVVLLKLGRPFAAKPLLEEVVRASPQHRRAWGYLGVTLEQLGLLQEAYAALLAGGYSGAAARLRERHALYFGPLGSGGDSGAQAAEADPVQEIPLSAIAANPRGPGRGRAPIPHLEAALSSLAVVARTGPH